MRNAREVLSLAAHLVGPDSYSPRFAAALPDGRQTFVLDPQATIFNITGLIERAARQHRGSGKIPGVGDQRAIAEAKAFVCLHLQVLHLDGWEIAAKPTWEDVRAALKGAATLQDA